MPKVFAIEKTCNPTNVVGHLRFLIHYRKVKGSRDLVLWGGGILVVEQQTPEKDVAGRCDHMVTDRFRGNKDFIDSLLRLCEVSNCDDAITQCYDRLGALVSKPPRRKRLKDFATMGLEVEFVDRIPAAYRSEPIVSGTAAYVPLVDHDTLAAWVKLDNFHEESLFSPEGQRACHDLARVVAALETRSASLWPREIRSGPRLAITAGFIAHVVFNRKTIVEGVVTPDRARLDEIGRFEPGAYLGLHDQETERRLRDCVQSLFLSCLSGSASCRFIRIESSQSEHPLVVSIAPILDDSISIANLLHDLRFSAVIMDPLENAGGTEKTLKEALGLTEKQSRVAVQLSSGMAASQIADLENCSEETVRWHIKQIGARLGLPRQQKLVAYLSRLVLLLPDRDAT